jgi:hypothetical protein
MLLEDYGTVLKFCYEHALRRAYEPNDNLLPMQCIEHVLSSHKLIDHESFFLHLNLWRYISTKIGLPNPQLEQILPYAVSQGNTIKGGSDTITKLLCLNMYNTPCKSPSRHVIARMFLLGNVIIHHLHQFFTSKSDLVKSYPSLKHYRIAASHTSTFHETLLLIVHGIK